MLRDIVKEFCESYEPVSEYARRCGVSRQWVHQMVKGGKLDAVRIGRSWFVRKEADGAS